MPKKNVPMMESLEDRCLLSACPAQLAPPPSHGAVIQATVAPLFGGTAKCNASTTVVSVDTVANTVTISAPKHRGQVAQTTYNVSPTAVLTIDGSPATLGEFVTGLKVTIQTDPANPTTVTSITAVGQQVQGKVTAVDTVAGTITLAGRKGGTTYTLGTGTVTVNGQPGALAGIAVGFEARITLSALDATKVVSIVATGDLYERVNVVSVDTVGNTITFSQTMRGVTTQTTLNVSPTAVITIDGQPGTLGQFVAGMKASLQTDPMDATSVVSITAIGQRVEGKVTAIDTTAGTITLTSRGVSTTYTVGTSLSVLVNGQPGALAGIAVGDEAQLTLSALDPTKVVVINATGDPYDRVSIVSVDPIGDTITFSQTVRGVTTQTTLNVSPAAVILIAGQPATLAQLVAGEQVTLETDPMDAGSVTSIVGPPQHEGHGRGGRR